MIEVEEMIDNPSDQLIGYAEEVACAVEEISKKFKYDKAFSLIVVQTAIDSMKVDCEHHKLQTATRIKDVLAEISMSLDRISYKGA